MLEVRPRKSTPLALKTKNLSLTYPGHGEVLHGISLSIEPQQITALVGPSGSGKSTYLRCFNRMNDLIAGVKMMGEIYVGESRVDGSVDVARLRRQVGMLFQRPNPFPLSIAQNVAFGPKAHGLSNERQLRAIVERSLQQVGLWSELKNQLHRSALELSGGQQQRLCLARALAVDPQALLLDEPTSALDPVSTAYLEDLFVELKKDITLVLVTHNLQQAARISDRTAFFLHGHLIEEGATEVLFTRPASTKTEAYITGRFG